MSPPELTADFAREFPELAVHWQAETPPQPRLLLLNEPLATELGLDPQWLRSPAGIGLLTGTDVPDGATPVAQAYAGHQFGNYVPLLGDGRALLAGWHHDFSLTEGSGRGGEAGTDLVGDAPGWWRRGVEHARSHDA